MARVQTNVAHRHVRTLTLDEFRGVDFTSSALDVDKRRAVSMKNLLPEAGRNVKRRGWVQEYRVDGRVHGMWHFLRGDLDTLIVHAGKLLYEYYEEDGVKKWRTVKGCTELLLDEDGEAFLYNGRMYLTGHEAYLVYGSWDGGTTFELREVADGEDTYIPTTTIGINPEGSTDADGQPKDTRTSWEPVNRLSSKRKNRLMGCSEAVTWWRLDSAVDWYNQNQNCDVTVEVEVKKGYGSVTYVLESRLHLEGVTFENDLVFVSDTAPSDFSKGAVGGKIYGGGKDRTTLTLNFVTSPPLEGEDNITVTFRRHVEGHAESIGKCRFGVLYGAGGNADRLFLAGNPDAPAVEYYSYWRDPTYFPDVYYNRVGSDYTDIVGFARVSDGVLAAFKETERQEPTVYYHTATEEVVYNDDKKLERVDFILTTQAGNVGEGMVSRRASVDFFGDPLILSENGVFGIVMRQNLMTADRYAAERSRNIREKLRSHADFSRAVGIVFENKYWLCVDGVCYVADEGYTYRPKESSSGYQYEWWYLDNVPAVVFAVMNGDLWFGTEDGRICRFRRRDEAEKYRFVDERYRYFSPWVTPGVIQDVEKLTVSDEDFSRIVASEGFISKLGTASMDALVLSSDTYALYLAAEDITVSGGRIILNDPDRISEVREGTVVYLDGLSSMGTVMEGMAYVIGDIDRGDGSFSLFYSNGGKIPSYPETMFRLFLLLTGRELFITDVDVEACTFSLRLYEEGEPLTLVVYGSSGSVADIHGRHVIRDVVAAEWYTPVLDLGTAVYGKTLERLTVALEPHSGGAITVGYETRAVNRLISARGLDGMDFGDMSFHDFTFSAFAGSNTVLCRERNVNYIAFRAISEEPHDMRLHALTVEYKITTANRGLV